MTTTKQTTAEKLKHRRRHVMVLDHARIDPSHCLTDGLFRPLKRESQDGYALSIKYIYKDYTFWWRNYEALSIADQSVFLAIHRLAVETVNIERVGPTHENPVMLEVREALKLKLDATNLDCLVLTTSLSEIAKTIGLSKGGKTRNQIRESLYRLSGVTFIIYRGEDDTTQFWQANLISQLGGVNGKIIVAINPTLSRALVGGQSTLVSMKEQRELKSDVTKRLHVWLTSWARAGIETKIHLDLLIPHVWGNTAEGTALWSRRSSLRRALGELNSLHGWICVEDKASGIVLIKRPELGNECISNS